MAVAVMGFFLWSRWRWQQKRIEKHDTLWHVWGRKLVRDLAEDRRMFRIH
jgi:hypothetical protein